MVEAKIVKAKKNYGYARLMNIVTPSENRVEKPACPMARRCGGCQIQEMKYGAQLAFKEGKVRDNLEPVSYTHLDVYKRQQWRMCKMLWSQHGNR